MALAAGIGGATFVGSALVFALWCDGPAIVALPAIVVPGLATGATVYLSLPPRRWWAVLLALVAAVGGSIIAVVVDLVAGISSCGLGVD